MSKLTLHWETPVLNLTLQIYLRGSGTCLVSGDVFRTVGNTLIHQKGKAACNCPLEAASERERIATAHCFTGKLVMVKVV